MPPASQRGTDTIAIASSELKIVFVRSADRFCHYIADSAAEEAALLASVEGAADDAWPPSPPWQEVHVERRGELQVALLVGRAGRSHWSMSVEPDAVENGLLFDVACRTSGQVGLLASTYRLGDAQAAVSLGNVVRFGAGYELQALTGEVEWSGTDGDRLVRIVPCRAEANSPQTIRWQYRLLPVRDRLIGFDKQGRQTGGWPS